MEAAGMRRRRTPMDDKRGAKPMTFSHPLARAAGIFTAHDSNGNKHHMLAVVTTLELDPEHHNYKKPFVERLCAAARKYLADSGKPTAFVLMNRPGDWQADRT
jgi:hypothetical protein